MANKRCIFLRLLPEQHVLPSNLALLRTQLDFSRSMSQGHSFSVMEGLLGWAPSTAAQTLARR